MILDRLKVVLEAEISGFKEGMREGIRESQALQKQADDTNTTIQAANLIKLDLLKAVLQEQKAELKALEKLAELTKKKVAGLNEALTSKAMNAKMLAPGSKGGAAVKLQAQLYQDLLDRIYSGNQEYEGYTIEIENTKQAIEDTTAKIVELKQVIKDTAAALKEVAKAERESNKEASEGNKSIISGLTKRMILLRIIRGLVYGTINIVREGVQYLAVYSKKLGDIAGYNATMSKLASSFEKMKITISVTAMEMIQAIAPVLTTIMDLVTYVGEAINNMMAHLSGKSTYTAANPEYWKDYAEYVKNSNDKLKETKQLISGFDELNIYNKLNSMFDTDNPLTIEKDVDETKALITEGLAIAALIAAIAKLIESFRSKNSILSYQTKLTEGETGKVAELALKYGVVTAAAFAFAGVLGKVIEGLKGIDELPAPAWNLDLQPVYYWLAEVQNAFGIVGQLVAAPITLQIAVAVIGIEAAKLAIDKVVEYGSIAVEAVQKVVSNAYSWVSEFATNAVASFSTVASTIIATVSLKIAEVKSIFDTAMATLQLSIAVALEGIYLKVNTWRVNAQTAFQQAFQYIYNSALSWKTNMVNSISTAMALLSNKVEVGWTQIKTSTITMISESLAAISVFVAKIKQAATDFKTSFVTKMTDALDSVKSKISEWATYAEATIGGVLAVATGGVYTKVKNVVSAATSAKTSTSPSFSEQWNTGWNNLKNNVGPWLDSLGDFVSKNWKKDQDFWEALADGMKGSSSSSLGSGSALMTLFDWMSKFGYAFFANGGVVNTPTLGIMGEYAGARQNPEIVTPSNLLKEIIDTSNNNLANVYINVGRQIISAIENQNLEVKIGDDAIARSAARGNKSYQKMTGQSLFA